MYARVVARDKDGKEISSDHPSLFDSYKSTYQESDVKIECNWDRFIEDNEGLYNWLEKRPESPTTKSLLFDAFKIRIPDELNTTDEIKKHIESHIDEYVKKSAIKIKRNGHTFDVTITGVEYGTCRYSVPVTYDITIDVPSNVVDGGEDDIRDYIYNNYRDYSDGDYGDYDYMDHEYESFEDETIDSISPDPAELNEDQED